MRNPSRFSPGPARFLPDRRRFGTFLTEVAEMMPRCRDMQRRAAVPAGVETVPMAESGVERGVPWVVAAGGGRRAGSVGALAPRRIAGQRSFPGWCRPAPGRQSGFESGSSGIIWWRGISRLGGRASGRSRGGWLWDARGRPHHAVLPASPAAEPRPVATRRREVGTTPTAVERRRGAGPAGTPVGPCRRSCPPAVEGSSRGGSGGGRGRTARSPCRTRTPPPHPPDPLRAVWCRGGAPTAGCGRRVRGRPRG